MSKKINEEKDFLEKVDRLLAGEEIEAGKDISEDYRSAINFAQKIIESRADPSPHTGSDPQNAVAQRGIWLSGGGQSSCLRSRRCSGRQ